MISIIGGARFGDERLDEIFNWRFSIKRFFYTVFKLYLKLARGKKPIQGRRTNQHCVCLSITSTQLQGFGIPKSLIQQRVSERRFRRCRRDDRRREERILKDKKSSPR